MEPVSVPFEYGRHRGVVRIANGSVLKDGDIKEVRLPKTWIERCQVWSTCAPSSSDVRLELPECHFHLLRRLLPAA